jgi:hypothetical protein
MHKTSKKRNKSEKVKIAHVSSTLSPECAHGEFHVRENYPYDVTAGCHTGVTQDYRRCKNCLLVQQAPRGGTYTTHRYTPSQIARINDIV